MRGVDVEAVLAVTVEVALGRGRRGSVGGGEGGVLPFDGVGGWGGGGGGGRTGAGPGPGMRPSLEGWGKGGMDIRSARQVGCGFCFFWGRGFCFILFFVIFGFFVWLRCFCQGMCSLRGKIGRQAVGEVLLPPSCFLHFVGFNWLV